MYRGWYKGKRTFGSAAVPWEFCIAEWNAQFLGDRAYRISEAEKTNLRWEAEQFRAGKLWHRWDYPYQVGSPVFDDQHTDHRHVPGRQLAGLPHLGRVGQLALGVPLLLEPARRRRQGPQGAHGRLGQPPAARASARTTSTSSSSAWTWPSSGPTGSRRPTAQALLRNNMPLLAYIGGKPAAFTSKDHNFLPGRNRREAAHHHQQLARDGDVPTAAGRSACRQPLTGAQTITVADGPTGAHSAALRLAGRPGAGQVRAERHRQVQQRRDAEGYLHDPRAAAAAAAPTATAKIALFDPKGETAAAADEHGHHVPAGRGRRRSRRLRHARSSARAR